MHSQRIAIVVGTFPVISQTFIVNQVNALIDSGHDVQLYAYKKGGRKHVHASLEKHDLLKRVRYLKKNHPNYFIRYGTFIKWTVTNFFKIRWRNYFKMLNVFKYGDESYLLSIFNAMAWSLTEKDFDIVHIHFAHNAKLLSYIKSLGLFPKKTKLITTFHGYDLVPSKHDFYKEAYNVVIENSDFFTVNSPYLKQQVLSLWPHLKNCAVLPVGLDTDYFSRTQPKNDVVHFDMVFCGRLILLKGLEQAITITKKLIDSGHTHVRLHIIGKGPLMQELTNQIKAYGLESHIFLKGALSQQEIKQQLEQADMFLLPGIADPGTQQEEAQGLVIQEAQAMELPVVVSDAGGMKYGLLPNETGFVVPRNDSDGFVKAIETLILDSELRHAMGKKGKAFVAKEYDNAVLASQLLKIYNQVIDTK